MTGTNEGKLVELLPELRKQGIIAQVTRFARLSLEMNTRRESCQIRAHVGGGKIGSFQKLGAV